jgi:transcriptional regulator with XRE-family HTH domain
MHVSLRSKSSLVRELISNKEYRDAYVFEHVRNGLAFQLRGIRDDLGWSQARMGLEVGKPQNVISRLEDPNYGRPNLQTLLEIASGLGVGLLVKFVPFSRLVKEFDDVSPLGLAARGISDEEEIRALENWAVIEDVGAMSTNRFTLATTAALVVTHASTGAVMQHATGIRGRLAPDQDRTLVSVPTELGYWVLHQSQENEFTQPTQVAA